jgi:hypothetical protein
VNAKGNTVGFLRTGHKVISFSAPGSTNSMALGVNNSDEVVGTYAGSGTIVHGFLGISSRVAGRPPIPLR